MFIREEVLISMWMFKGAFLLEGGAFRGSVLIRGNLVTLKNVVYHV